jgi:hypothetical protein
VALVVTEVRLPPAREWVEVDALRLLFAVAAASPRIHRAAITGLASVGPCLAEAPEAVHPQSAGDVGKAKVEEGEDVQLVPEDMSAIGLAVEASGRDAGIPVRRVAGADLQDVGDVKAQEKLDAIVTWQSHVPRTPQLVPRTLVAFERLGEPGIATGGLACTPQRFADRAVA